MGLRSVLHPLVADRARRIAPGAAAEHHARRPRTRAEDVVRVAHRARGLEVERRRHRARLHAGPHLEVGEERVELAQIVGGLDLGQPHRLEGGAHDRFEIVEREPRLQAVDANRPVPAPGRERFERLPDEAAGTSLLGDRNGILEVEDEHVRPGPHRLRHPVGQVSGHEEPGAMEPRTLPASAHVRPPPALAGTPCAHVRVEHSRLLPRRQAAAIRPRERPAAVRTRNLAPMSMRFAPAPIP